MSSFFFTLASFIVAISLLVTVHEFGHYWVARKVGVKVLRFSIGFGKPFYLRRFGEDRTEFAIASIPLGGYVKMLDEREGPVAAQERDRAFNRKPVGSRIAVVIAGPAFNFIFALVIYWIMFVSGIPGIKPIIGEVLPDTPAAIAEFEPLDRIHAIDGREIRSWNEALMALLDNALANDSMDIQVVGGDGIVRDRVMDLTQVEGLLDEGNLLDKIGFKVWVPKVAPVFGELSPGEPAAEAGIKPGDRIISADGEKIEDWAQWVKFVQARPEQDIALLLIRGSEHIELKLRPTRMETKQGEIGRIGAYNQPDPDQTDDYRTVVHYGPLEAVGASVRKSWDMIELTLRSMWKMLLGELSIKNLSGPITIAEVAGKTASIGLVAFLSFLGLVSISLGVINLLPIPVLDGGHLLYYLIELLKGSPLSENAEAFGQRIGIALILAFMSLAIVNDLMRLFE